MITKYEYDKGCEVCFTECPNGLAAMAGSIACQNYCNNLIKHDEKNQTVECNKIYTAED